MPNLSPEKIRTPAGSDNYSLVNDLRLMGESLYSIIPVANTTERAAIVSALATAGRPVSSSSPLTVYRADAASHSRVERSINGTDWFTDSAGTGIIAPLGGAGQNVGTNVESALSVGTPTKNSGWTWSSSSITIPEPSLIFVTVQLNANTDVTARHFMRVTVAGQSLIGPAYGDRALSISGQLLVGAGAVLQVYVYQNSGANRTYTGQACITARPIPVGW